MNTFIVGNSTSLALYNQAVNFDMGECSIVRGKVMWRDFMTFDNWEYGGLDDDSKQSKAFVADYNMKTDMDKLHEVNNGFCLSG